MAAQHPVPIVERGRGYGIEAVSVDGNDVSGVAATVGGLVRRMRAGEGPFLVEAATYRWRGHYEGDPIRYRGGDELAPWQAMDPLLALGAELDRLGLAAQLAAMQERVAAGLADAEKAAGQAPYPAAEELFSAVEAPRRDIPEPTSPPPPVAGAAYRTSDAIHEAMLATLREVPEAFVAGIDVGAGGNIFGLTRDLHDEFPQRVLDTPISESALIGLAVGGAMSGMKPIVEIMYIDFIGVCFDQLMNQAEALLAHIPGLTVVMPSTPEDTYGLLRAAIADPNPVVFVEHRLLYGKKGIRPPPGHLVPLGKAAIRRPRD